MHLYEVIFQNPTGGIIKGRVLSYHEKLEKYLGGQLVLAMEIAGIITIEYLGVYEEDANYVKKKGFLHIMKISETIIPIFWEKIFWNFQPNFLGKIIKKKPSIEWIIYPPNSVLEGVSQGYGCCNFGKGLIWTTGGSHTFLFAEAEKCEGKSWLKITKTKIWTFIQNGVPKEGNLDLFSGIQLEKSQAA